MPNLIRKKALRQMLSITAAATLLLQSNAMLIANATVTATSSRITATTTAASTYKNWKQYNAAWADLPVGKFGGDMRSIGCAVTAAAILCAASHSSVPADFDPGVLCDFLTKNGGFSVSGDLQWQAISKLVPDFSYESTRTFSNKNQRDQIAELTSYLADGYFVAVKLSLTVNGTYTSHFVAIDRIENGIVYMFDPGSSYDVLYDKYSSYMLESVRLFRGADSPAITAPEAPAQQSIGAYLTTARLNLRNGASTEHNVLTVLPKDTYIEITEVTEEWGRISYNGINGWVNMRYCTPAISIFTTGDYCTDAQTLTLRDAPVATATAVGYLPPNTIITVTEINGDWGYCTYDGKSGWVSLRYCTCSEGSAEIGISLRYTTAENNMRLRTGASIATATLTVLPPDTAFTITQMEGNWGKTIYKGQIGWIYIPYCTLITDDTPEESICGLYTTGNNNLRLRAEATDTSETLAYIGTNTELRITQINDGWGKTTYNGKDGWVYLAYCTLVTEYFSTELDSPWYADLGDCVVVVDGLHIYTEIDGATTDIVTIGTHVTVVDIKADWAKIHWNGNIGWIRLGEYGTPYLYLAGDITLDGAVDASDHKLMEAFFSGVALPDALQMLVADINGDGSVNAIDRAMLAEKGE